MNDQSLNDQSQNFDHVQISLKNQFIIIVYTDIKSTNSDLFVYVMTFDRYISENFYEVIIDSIASTKLTAEYDQYLTFKKNKIDYSVDLDSSRAETVNVQFDIESASSIKSLIIDLIRNSEISRDQDRHLISTKSCRHESIESSFQQRH
jgi:hypothetical protein